MAEVLLVGGVFRFGRDDVGQVHVRAEEAVEDPGLDAERPLGQEAGEVEEGVAPLVLHHEFPQPKHAEEGGVRLAQHPARTPQRKSPHQFHSSTTQRKHQQGRGGGERPREVYVRFGGGFEALEPEQVDQATLAEPPNAGVLHLAVDWEFPVAAHR